MCDKCDEEARSPSPQRLEAFEAEIAHGARSIQITLTLNFGDPRDPLEAAVRIATARAWAQIQEELVRLSPACRELADRLVREHLEKARPRIAAAQATAEGKRPPPNCAVPKINCPPARA